LEGRKRGTGVGHGQRIMKLGAGMRRGIHGLFFYVKKSKVNLLLNQKKERKIESIGQKRTGGAPT